MGRTSITLLMEMVTLRIREDPRVTRTQLIMQHLPVSRTRDTSQKMREGTSLRQWRQP